MTRKLTTLAVFLLLLGIWWWRSNTGQTQERPSRERPMLGLEVDDVHSLRIQWPDKSVVLRRNGTYWTLPRWNNYPADQTYADILFRTLLATPRGDVVSENPANYAEYGLSPAKRQVDLFDAEGKQVASLLVGDSVVGYRAAFVRLADSPEVRRVDADLIPSLSRVTWADRSVWRLSESLILSVAVTGFANNFLATREDGQGTWRLDGPEEGTLSGGFASKLLPFLAHPKAENVVFRSDADFTVQASLHVKTSLTEMVLELGDLHADIIQGRYADEPVIFQFSPRILHLVERAVGGRP